MKKSTIVGFAAFFIVVGSLFLIGTAISFFGDHSGYDLDGSEERARALISGVSTFFLFLFWGLILIILGDIRKKLCEDNESETIEIPQEKETIS